MADQRATVRIAVFLAGELASPPNAPWKAVDVVDISPAGAAIHAEDDWPVGAPVRFRCQLPDRDGTLPIDVCGEIRWQAQPTATGGILARDRFRYGIQFAQLDTRLEDQFVGALFFLQTSRPR